jgi:hypothetical protein
MFTKTIPLIVVSMSILASGAAANDLEPSKEEAARIEMHASSWNLVLKREQLKTMTNNWRGLTATPDSAASYFDEMLPVANNIVDQLAATTGYSRGLLMRWLEKDTGVNAYFFPPGPEQHMAKNDGVLWGILKPLLPILLYRVVDEAFND